MKHTFRTLLGLVLVVFVLAGCSNPAGPETETPIVEVPEGVKVEFVLAANPQVAKLSRTDNREIYLSLHRYFLDLYEQEENEWVFGYPEGYNRDQYIELYNNSEEYLKEFYEKAFKEVFGNIYYKEGTPINLTKWTSEARDLTTGEYPGYLRLYFLTEDVEITEDTKSLETIEFYNQKVYVYWKYSR